MLGREDWYVKYKELLATCCNLRVENDDAKNKNSMGKAERSLVISSAAYKPDVMILLHSQMSVDIRQLQAWRSSSSGRSLRTSSPRYRLPCPEILLRRRAGSEFHLSFTAHDSPSFPL